MRKRIILLLSNLLFLPTSMAATVIDLHRIQYSVPQSSLSATNIPRKNMRSMPGQIDLKVTQTHIDFNHISHIRYQQIYKGYPVWAAEAVVHTSQHLSTPLTNIRSISAQINPQTSMNGKVYDDLDADLAATPSYVLSKENQIKAIEFVKLQYAKEHHYSTEQLSQESIKTVVYVDEKNVAHYAYLSSFLINDANTGMHRPLILSDAVTMQIYHDNDLIMHFDRSAKETKLISVGGIGGNKKIGQRIYDDEPGHLPALKMEYDSEKYQCIFKNTDLIVKDVAYPNNPASISSDCDKGLLHPKPDGWVSVENNETEWTDDAANDAYSPSLDAFYAGSVTISLFKNRYNLSLINNDDSNTPHQVILNVHYGRNNANAFWDPVGKQVYIGDGNKDIFPLASFMIVAHELGHAVTSQHSKLNLYIPQMNALNEAFSDMVSVAASYYADGKENWILGPDITKKEDIARYRYFDDPTIPNQYLDPDEGIYIDQLKDMDLAKDNPYFIAGIERKAFYLLAKSPDWGISKAFDVMLKANTDYWTSDMKTLEEAACGVISATKDYRYNVADVKSAFLKVGINTDNCQ